MCDVTAARSRLENFIATRNRYMKASARRQLTATLPMSADFAKLLGRAGPTELPKHVVIEHLVDQGTRIVPHIERTMRGSTMRITIGRALTIPTKPGRVWSMAESGKYGEAYAAFLGAEEEAEAETTNAIAAGEEEEAEICELCQGAGPLLEQRCRACIERRYKQVLREHGEALHESGGRLGAVLSLRATPAYQGRVYAMVRMRKYLGIPEIGDES